MAEQARGEALLGILTMKDENGKTIDPKSVGAFNISTANNVLFIDNVRLVRGVEEVAVKGIKKFDFGPASSALMP